MLNFWLTLQKQNLSANQILTICSAIPFKLPKPGQLLQSLLLWSGCAAITLSASKTWFPPRPAAAAFVLLWISISLVGLSADKHHCCASRPNIKLVLMAHISAATVLCRIKSNLTELHRFFLSFLMTDHMIRTNIHTDMTQL